MVRVRCDMCSSGLHFKVKSWSLDFQANCGRLWQPSYTPECRFWPKWCGHLTQLFLKPSKSKCVFQCFTLGEKLCLRTRLYFMRFVLFSFFFCLGIHTRFSIFPPLLSPSFWRNGKICKFGWNLTVSSSVTTHTCSQVFTIWAFTSYSEHVFSCRICPIKFIVFFS